MHSIQFNNTHHDVSDLVNHGIVKNTKTWIFWERNITILWNKKIYNCVSDDTFCKVSFCSGGNLSGLLKKCQLKNIASVNDLTVFWNA